MVGVKLLGPPVGNGLEKTLEKQEREYAEPGRYIISWLSGDTPSGSWVGAMSVTHPHSILSGIPAAPEGLNAKAHPLDSDRKVGFELDGRARQPGGISAGSQFVQRISRSRAGGKDGQLAVGSVGSGAENIEIPRWRSTRCGSLEDAHLERRLPRLHAEKIEIQRVAVRCVVAGKDDRTAHDLCCLRRVVAVIGFVDCCRCCHVSLLQ